MKRYLQIINESSFVTRDSAGEVLFRDGDLELMRAGGEIKVKGDLSLNLSIACILLERFNKANFEDFVGLSFREVENYLRDENHIAVCSATGCEFDFFQGLKKAMIELKVMGETTALEGFGSSGLAQDTLLVQNCLEQVFLAKQAQLSRFVTDLDLLAFDSTQVVIELKVKLNLPPLVIEAIEKVIGRLLRCDDIKLVVEEIEIG